MLRIKRLDIFILRSFLLLFVGTFFICLFIFMMQYLWRFVDDLVGKGLEMTVIAQFFFYSALTLVPVALPLAVLLASLITFGNFGERYELLAMKAAGISLLRIMRPLIVLSCILCAVSFYFQNVVGPNAQYKLTTLMLSVKNTSPEVDIPEGVFYSEIPNYNLKIKSKDRKTGMMYDVLIYNMQDGFANAHIIYADSARLEMTADQKHLWLHLYHGELFENLRSQTGGAKNVPYRRETFVEKSSIIEFNSGFEMVDGSLAGGQAQAKNMRMIEASIDSMKVVGDSIGRQYFKEAMTGPFQKVDGLGKEDSVKAVEMAAARLDIDSLFASATLTDRQKVINSAASGAMNFSSDLVFKKINMDNNDGQIRRHKAEWHRKLTISLSCLLFFLIGAPLGGIIRKGGLGMPVIVSVFTFIIYYIIDNMGYKMARDNKWIVWMGMWTSTAVLAPLGLFLTYKSNKDSVVLNIDAYLSWIKKVAGIRDVRHVFRKEVILHDPDYGTLPARLAALSDACTAYLQQNRLKKAPNYFRLWFSGEREDEVSSISRQMEALVEEMSNTRSINIVNMLNNYPLIPVHAHIRPFRIYWLNLLAGIVVPLGLFFYFRIWIFRLRLLKDLKRVVQNNQYIIGYLEKAQLK